MNPHYAVVAERAVHRCEYCGAPEAIFNLPFEVEHIIPPGRGGADHENDLVMIWPAFTYSISTQRTSHGLSLSGTLLISSARPKTSTLRLLTGAPESSATRRLFRPLTPASCSWTSSSSEPLS